MKNSENAESPISAIEYSASALRRASGKPAQAVHNPSKSDSDTSMPQQSTVQRSGKEPSEFPSPFRTAGDLGNHKPAPPIRCYNPSHHVKPAWIHPWPRRRYCATGPAADISCQQGRSKGHQDLLLLLYHDRRQALPRWPESGLRQLCCEGSGASQSCCHCGCWRHCWNRHS